MHIETTNGLSCSLGWRDNSIANLARLRDGLGGHSIGAVLLARRNAGVPRDSEFLCSSRQTCTESTANASVSL